MTACESSLDQSSQPPQPSSEQMTLLPYGIELPEMPVGYSFSETPNDDGVSYDIKGEGLEGSISVGPYDGDSSVTTDSQYESVNFSVGTSYSRSIPGAQSSERVRWVIIPHDAGPGAGLVGTFNCKNEGCRVLSQLIDAVEES